MLQPRTWPGIGQGVIVDSDRTTVNCFEDSHSAFPRSMRGIVHLHQAYSNTVPTRLTDGQTREIEVSSISFNTRAVRTKRCFGEWVCGVDNLSTKLVVKNFTGVVDECCNSPCLGKL